MGHRPLSRMTKPGAQSSSPETRAALSAFNSSQTCCLRPQGPAQAVALVQPAPLPSSPGYSLLPFLIPAQKSFPFEQPSAKTLGWYKPLHAATPPLFIRVPAPGLGGLQDSCPGLLWPVSPRGQHLCLFCSVLNAQH